MSFSFTQIGVYPPAVESTFSIRAYSVAINSLQVLQNGIAAAGSLAPNTRQYYSYTARYMGLNVNWVVVVYQGAPTLYVGTAPYPDAMTNVGMRQLSSTFVLVMNGISQKQIEYIKARVA